MAYNERRSSGINDAWEVARRASPSMDDMRNMNNTDMLEQAIGNMVSGRQNPAILAAQAQNRGIQQQNIADFRGRPSSGYHAMGQNADAPRSNTFKENAARVSGSGSGSGGTLYERLSSILSTNRSSPDQLVSSILQTLMEEITKGTPTGTSPNA